MKKNIALLGIILGGFLFSFELYLLKILLTIFIILFCFGLFFFGKNKS